MSCLVTLLFLLFIAIALEPTFLIAIGLFLFVMTLIFFNSKNKIDKKSTKEEYVFQNKVEKRDVSVTNVNNRKKYDYIKARKLDNDITVLDFETTGFSPIDNQLIQIGAIKYRDGDEVDRFVTYVNPEISIPQKITNITGITTEDVESAPTIKEVIYDLHDFLQNETIVAHNASFDMKFLLENLQKHDIQYEHFRVIDTLQLARKHINETDNHKLATLKDFLQIEATSHDALEDCKVTGNLYYYCKDLEENKPGSYNGKHFTEYVDTIVEMKRANQNIEAINLLLNLVDAVESESKESRLGPAPWYYEQLAILYRKEKKHKNEVSILERYIKTCEKYGIPNGAKHSKLVERYKKLVN